MVAQNNLDNREFSIFWARKTSKSFDRSESCNRIAIFKVTDGALPRIVNMIARIVTQYIAHSI